MQRTQVQPMAVAPVTITSRPERGRTVLLSIFCGLLFAFAGVLPAHAQIADGQISGTVRDSTGAIVRKARITLTNVATNVRQFTLSTSTGTYVFPVVAVGTYRLSADAPGFKTYVETGIQVHVQNVDTEDITLAVGAVSQSVTVTSAAPLLQAQDASVGQTIPEASVDDLPLNGRNWFSLAQTSAGAIAPANTSPDSANQLWANGVNQNQVDYRLDGIDDNIEVFDTGANNQVGSVAPVPDAVQEFKLQEGDNSAEFGQFTGAVVNAVVKSGTNRFKGDLWEYFRNQALNANAYFNKQNGVPRQQYQQNQFGGTIGGPVSIPHVYHGRNRTFFFFDFQRTNVRQQAAFTDTVPTNAMRSSGYTNLQGLITGNSGSNVDALGRKFPHGTILDPETTRAVAAGAVDPISGLTNKSTSTVYVRDPFYNCTSGGCPASNEQPGGSLTGLVDFTAVPVSSLNTLPGDRLDANAVNLLRLLPAPNVANTLQDDYYAVPSATQYTNQYDLRIDEDLSAKDMIWGVFSRSYQQLNSYQPFSGIAGGALQINPNDREPHYEIAVHYTHVFSPTLENDLTFGDDHAIHNLTMPTAGTLGLPAQYGIQGIPQIAGNGGLPTIDYSGFTSFGGRRYMPTLETTSGMEVFENLMKVFGRHELRAGFEFNHIVGDITQPGYSKGEFGFNGSYTDIVNKNSNLTGLGEFLLSPGATRVAGYGGVGNLGGLSSYTGSNYAATDYFANYYGAYVQDNWRITPSLTANLGLRWSYSSPYGEASGQQANFQETNGDGAGGVYYMPRQSCSTPRSAIFNSLLAGYNIQISCVPGTRVYRGQKTNFAPRLGISYRILPRLVIRSGYGISYGAFDSVGYGGTLGTNYPFQFVIQNPSLTSYTPDLLPNGTPATIEDTFGTIGLQNPLSVTGTGLSLYGKQYEYKTPYVVSANLTIQDQFTNHDSIQVGYVGSLGRNLDSFGRQNSPSQILPPGVNQTNYRPFPKLNPNMEDISTIALSNYNSLQAIYQHQFASGLVFLANYTYSKCMADNGGSLSQGYRAQWLPGFGIGQDYALCNNDTTHVVHVSGEYALPIGRGKELLRNGNRLTDALLGGWNFNYIFTVQSGQPFNVGCPTPTTSDFGCDANLVASADPYAGPHDQKQWLNRSAFAKPPTATAVGQTDYAPLGGRPEQVRGPGFYNLDASLFKNFATGAGTSLQFRLETFNTLNHPQFNNPGQLNFTNATNFSRITGTRNGYRIGQLAVKLFF